MSALAPTAGAAPQGIFSVFAQCPTSVPGVTLCDYVEITSGELAIGQVKIPIDKKIVFQGGLLPVGLNLYFLLPAVNGESISSTKLEVPGGLRTVLGCPPGQRRRGDSRHVLPWGFCRDRSHHWAHHEDSWGDGVTATLEGVANQTNPAILDLAALVTATDTGLTFPGRVHLENRLLGESCYIGSEAHPIELRFTDGTTSPPPPNQPISGKFGEASEPEEEGHSLLTVTNNTLIDNAFSIPPVEGCGGPFEQAVDARIDGALGLESPAGRNTAILTGTHRLAKAEEVLASETFPTKENPPPHHRHHHWWSTH